MSGKNRDEDYSSDVATDLELCQKCHEVNIKHPMPSFAIGCHQQCEICCVCFSNFMYQALRSSDVKCLLCNGEFDSWTCHFDRLQPSRTQGFRNIKHRKSEDSFRLPTPELRHDPIDHHRSLLQPSECATLTLTTHCRNTNQVKISTAKFSTSDESDCNDWDQRTLQTLEGIGVFLHSMLITQDKLRNKPRMTATKSGAPKYDNVPTINGIRSIAIQDYSPLHRFVFSLAYGDYLRKYNLCNPDTGDRDTGVDQNKNIYHNRLICQTWVVTDMMRHIRNANHGEVKAIVTAHLEANNVNKTVFELLNNLGVTMSYSTKLRESYRAVADNLQKGIDKIFKMDRHSVLQALFDNVGYRMSGGFENVGYLQMTILITAMIPREKLVEWGIYYKDPKNPDGVLKCRERKEWELERKKDDVDFETVMAPTDKDYDNLALTMTSIIDQILSMVHRGTMMSHSDAQDLLSDNIYEWIHEIPDPVTRQCPIPDDNNNKSTHFERNHAIVDRAMQMDLGKKETCVKLGNYMERLKETNLAQRPAEGWEDVRPISKDIPIMLACDGQLAGQIQRLKMTNEIQTQTIVAGFHLSLSAYKALGKLFAETHLKDFFKCWRKSDKQLKWVLDPGDLNQVEEELTMMMMGILSDATFHCVNKKKREAGDSRSASVDVSSTDVIDHIIKRAIEYPMVHTVTMTFPIFCLLTMLQNAERNADAEAYNGIMRLLVNVFASAHQTGYVYLITRYFVNWYCASEAEREITAKGYLFKKTVNGRNIFCDRFVEWTVRYLRQTTGKKALSRNYSQVVERACAFLNERCKIKKQAKKSSNEDTESERNGLKLDKVFMESFLYSNDLNLWGEGPPRYVPGKPFAKRAANQNPSYSHAGPDELKGINGTPLNDSIFFFRSIGSQRCKEYFEKFEIEQDLRNQERPEKEGVGVPLTLIEPLASAANATAQDRLDRWTSVDKEFLEQKGIYTVKELQVELKYLNDLLESHEIVKVKSNANKPTWVDGVIKARKVLMKKDPGWKANRTREKTPCDLIQATRAKREEELSHKFFSFVGTTSYESSRAKTYTFRILRRDQRNSNEDNHQQASQQDSERTLSQPSRQSQPSMRTTPSTSHLTGKRGFPTLRRLLRKKLRTNN